LNLAVKPSSSRHESTLIWAVISSIAVHALLLAIPKFEVEPIKLPEVLTITLMSPAEPPSEVPTKPTPPTPEPVKPKPTPKPIIKPINRPQAITDAPPPERPAASTQTEVIALSPKAEAAPSPIPTLAPPEPPKPAAPSQTDMTAALNSYNSMLWGRIAKYKLYPKIAQMRGWQGEVIVELLLDGNGKLKSKKIISGSGYDVLDKQALDMIDKAAPFPAPPEALRSSSFSITVPIPFKLE
jgi:protein TonB